MSQHPHRTFMDFYQHGGMPNADTLVLAVGFLVGGDLPETAAAVAKVAECTFPQHRNWPWKTPTEGEA